LARIRVMVVDDSEDMRLLCRLALAGEPTIDVCAEAADGYEAVALAADNGPDLILLDYLMPRMDGLTALSLLREVCPDAVVIFLSASASIGVQHEALAQGAFAVIDKGGDFAKLSRIVIDACRPEAERTIRHVLA